VNVTRGSASASLANRGAGLERFLDELHATYLARGQACVFRTPPPVRILKPQGKGTFLAVHAASGPPDYTGFAAGKGVCFDAKECADTRWNFGHLPVHQAVALDAAQGQGAFCFLYLRLAGGDFVLPWATLGPRWHAWDTAPGRAPAGTASITVGDAIALGTKVTGKGWLTALPHLSESP